MAPADPAAVSGFVEGTRAQMVAGPAIADSTDMGEPVLVRIPSLMLDPAALRQPRHVRDTLPVPEPVAPLQHAQQPEMRQTPQPEVMVAQAQTPRPLSRPVDLGDVQRSEAERAQVRTPMRTNQNATPRVVPVATQQTAPRSNQSAASPDRLKSVWMTGAFR